MKGKTLPWLLAVLLCLLAGFATACQSNDPKDFKVGFVYSGLVGESGWNAAHDAARKALEGSLGVTTYIAEQADTTQQAEQAIAGLVKKGCRLIIATSAGHTQATLAAGERYKSVVFIQHALAAPAQRVGGYSADMYPALYLCGMAAAYATNMEAIGYVAPAPQMGGLANINAFALGVRAVKPDAAVRLSWVGAPYDPVLERQRGEALLAAGCDVIATAQESPAALDAAEAALLYSIGYQTSMRDIAPQGYLTAALWDFAPYFTTLTQAVMAGTYTPALYHGGLADGMVTLDGYGAPLTQEARAALDEKRDQLVRGDWAVFYGPIADQSGDIRVAQGETLQGAALASMDWLAQGVEGALP